MGAGSSCFNPTSSSAADNLSKDVAKAMVHVERLRVLEESYVPVIQPSGPSKRRINSIEFASSPAGHALADSAPGSIPKDAASHVHMAVRRGSFALAGGGASRQGLEAASEEATSSKSGGGSPPHAHYDKELLTVACDVLQHRSMMMISRKSLQATRSGANLAGIDQEAAAPTGSNQ